MIEVIRLDCVEPFLFYKIHLFFSPPTKVSIYVQIITKGFFLLPLQENKTINLDTVLSCVQSALDLLFGLTACVVCLLRESRR